MIRTIIALVVTLLIVATPLHLTFAAESIVEGTQEHPAGDLWYVDITCTADTDASFDTQVTGAHYCGYLYGIETDPGATGPTDDSDLDIYYTVAGAATSTEMLGAQGDDIIDNATNNYVKLTSEILICGPLGIDMQNNAVNSASFRLRLYYRIPGTD